MLDDKQRAHELAMLYINEHIRQGNFGSPMDDKFADFTSEYADAYLYIYERLQSDCMVDN